MSARPAARVIAPAPSAPASAPPSSAVRQARWRRLLLVGSLAAYLGATTGIAHSSSYDQGLLLVAVVYAILALSLDLVAGAAGLYSLGHAGLFAIGAYGTTILQGTYNWNVFEALPAMVAAAGVVGIVIGALSLRVSGLYFAITTLIFTIIVNVLLSNLTITGGYQGLPSPSFPVFPSVLTGFGTPLVWAVSGSLLLTVTVVWSVRSSPLYPVLLAIRDSEPFAASMGVRTARTTVLIFGLSAALAGLAGWAFCFLGFITPGQFDSTASINILVMVILGGMNTRLGPILGAAFIGLFPVVVSINPLWQEILFGAIFLVVIVFFPEGIVGVAMRALRRVRPDGRRADVNSQEAPLVARETRSPRSLGGSEEAGPSSAPRPQGGPFPSSDHTALPYDDDLALEARGIVFSYTGGQRALDGVDLIVRRGTIHGLIGPNGSGKSTLVNLVSGQLSPQSGTIMVNGRQAEHRPAWQRPELGLRRTFQTAGMVEELSLSANVGVGLFSRYRRIGSRAPAWPMLRSGRRDTRAITASSIAALRSVGVEASWANSRVADIPHGVEQLTQLAAACAGSPSVLILDEPLAGLSHGEVSHVSTILVDLKAKGVTVIVVEHQTRFIFDVCDEVTVLAAGQLVATGSAESVRVDARVREVYLGL